MKPAYYNEIDKKAAAWLRELIADGQIAPGDVDDRSICDVEPADLAGYGQVHLFAGIGGWSIAARLAGWPDDRELWSASCPCQPFSVAGKGAGVADARHLWPDVFRLMRARRPAFLVGEQVAAAVGKDWFVGVRSDLESIGYVGRGIVVPACAVNAPHRRDRLWFVAGSRVLGDCDGERSAARFSGSHTGHVGVAGIAFDASGADGLLEDSASGGDRAPFVGGEVQRALAGRSASGLARSGGGDHGAVSDPERKRIRGGGPECFDEASPAVQRIDGQRERARPDSWAVRVPECDVADTDGRNAGAERQQRSGEQRLQPQDGGDSARLSIGPVAHNDCGRRSAGLDHATAGYGHPVATTSRPGAWDSARWLISHDGKARRVEPGIPLLVDGLPARASLLRGYGNAIVPALAAEVIGAWMDAEVEA